MMIEDDLERLIDEIRELAEIPEFKKSLLHKINELKVLLSDDIECQREINEMLCQRKSNEKHETHGKIGNIKGKPFHLNRIGEDTWIPTIPGISDGGEDSQVCDFDIFAIIPMSIIKFITHYEGKKREPVMLPGLTLPDLKGRSFNLIFEKQSEDCFTGFIHEIESSSEEATAKKEKAFKIANQIDSMGKREHQFKNIKQLNQYLLKNDSYYLHVISDFLTRWKPLIDSQHLEINAE
jgi:hypothetical protein